jgi:hypothetical protein
MREQPSVLPEALEARRLLATFWFGDPPPGIDPVPIDPPPAVPLPLIWHDPSRGWGLNVTAAGGTSHRLAFKFYTGGPIDESTVVGNNNVFFVSGPGTFTAPLRYVESATVSGDLVAAYEFDAPGGTWDRADNGAYTISMRGGQVRNLAGQWNPNTVAGGIEVKVPGPMARFAGDGDARFNGTSRLKGRRLRAIFELAFDAPRQGEFEVAALFGVGSILTGTARLDGNKLVVEAHGSTDRNRPRVLRLTGRVDDSGAIVGRWTYKVRGKRGAQAGTFSLAPGPAETLMWLGGGY